MPKKFILEEILFKVIVINSNPKKDERYVIDLNITNIENDLYYALATDRIKKTSISNSYIYTNINKVRQNPYLKRVLSSTIFKQFYSLSKIVSLSMMI